MSAKTVLHHPALQIINIMPPSLRKLIPRLMPNLFHKTDGHFAGPRASCTSIHINVQGRSSGGSGEAGNLMKPLLQIWGRGREGEAREGEKIPYLPSKFTVLPYLPSEKFVFLICHCAKFGFPSCHSRPSVRQTELQTTWKDNFTLGIDSVVKFAISFLAISMCLTSWYN